MASGGRTVRDLRRENRTAVLQRLYFDGPLSRYSLGPATGLSSGSVSNVVAELVADGLVEEAGSVDSAGGRPRILLRIAPGSGYMIGVDIGETRIRIELFDLSLAELARVERPLASTAGVRRTDRYDVNVVLAHLREGITEVLAQAGIDPRHLLGVGIGVPGIVARTPGEGAVVHGQTIGWDAVPLERLLRESALLPESVPYYIDNGAKTLGQAEMWFGAGRGARNAVVVLFGSGVGACVVTDEVTPGRAVEWGHLTVRVKGRRCRCGAQGCLEAYAGAEALLDRWAEAGGQPPAGADEETALTAMLAAAYPPVRGDGSAGGGAPVGDGGFAGGGVSVGDGGFARDGVSVGGGASGGEGDPVSGGVSALDGRAAPAGAAGGGGAPVHEGASFGDGPAVQAGSPAEAGAPPEADATALAVLEETAEYLGAGFSDLINLFQPERILVGGWAGLQLGSRFLDSVRAHATSYALSYPASLVTISLGTLGPDAVTVGAAILPLADFFARGGHPAPPEPADHAPAWHRTLRERTAH